MLQFERAGILCASLQEMIIILAYEFTAFQASVTASHIYYSLLQAPLRDNYDNCNRYKYTSIIAYVLPRASKMQ